MAKLMYANTKNSDMLYCVKVEIPDPFFYIQIQNKEYVFLDHREYGVFAEHNHNPNIELVLLNPLLEEAAMMPDNTSVVNKLAFLLLQKYNLLAEKIEVPTAFPLDMADFLRSKGIRLTPVSSLYPKRLCKTKEEAENIREALRRTCKAYEKIEEILRASSIENDTVLYQGQILTSEYLKASVEQVLLEQDMLNVEGIIISCGPHAAIPHHRGSGPIRPHQTIVCDIFPRHRESGYFADMTRTYVKGNPSDEIKKLYEAVLEAQTQGIQKVKPAVKMADVHQTCVDTFLNLGYHSGDKGFIHGTGHGLGLDIHELPYVKAGNETLFEVGHVVTVEPGLYYPEIGGVRIEDVVWVTEDGCENLTDYHKDYIIP